MKPKFRIGNATLEAQILAKIEKLGRNFVSAAQFFRLWRIASLTQISGQLPSRKRIYSQILELTGLQAQRASIGNHCAIVGTKLGPGEKYFGSHICRIALQFRPQSQICADAACNDQSS